MFPAVAAASRPDPGAPGRGPLRSQGLTALHVACLHGDLATVRLLLGSGLAWVNSSNCEGRRPLHLVLSSRSAPNTAACLTHLLEHDAAVDLATHSGRTPLHLAASEGLSACVEILVRAGADVLARDNAGHTPFDLARIWGHRKLARYLRSCVWQAEKRKEAEQRARVQELYRELVEAAKQTKLHKEALNKDVSDWTDRKGPPLLEETSPTAQESRHHGERLVPRPPKQSKDRKQRAKAPPTRPWTIFLGRRPEGPLAEPDLRDVVTLTRAGGGKLLLDTAWDPAPRPAPVLPLDVLERALFPRAFPPKTVPARPVEAVPRRGRPPGRSASPWTEVAMHLVEALEPGRY